jgi:hypothetical protein
MPLEDIRGVLHTTDLAARSELIARHLRRLEQELSRTQSAVASLRELLEQPASDVPIEHRSIPHMRVAAISQQVTIADVGPWYNGAPGELYATLSAQGTALAGHAGAIYADALFSQERGQATVYLPTNTPFRATGRVETLELPPADLAVIAHDGPHENGIDRAYGPWPATSPGAPWPSTGQSGSSTRSTGTTPATPPAGGPRSDGPSSRRLPADGTESSQNPAPPSTQASRAAAGPSGRYRREIASISCASGSIALMNSVATAARHPMTVPPEWHVPARRQRRRPALRPRPPE